MRQGVSGSPVDISHHRIILKRLKYCSLVEIDQSGIVLKQTIKIKLNK